MQDSILGHSSGNVADSYEGPEGEIEAGSGRAGEGVEDLICHISARSLTAISIMDVAAKSPSLDR